METTRITVGVTGTSYFADEVSAATLDSDRWRVRRLQIPTNANPGIGWGAFWEVVTSLDVWYRIGGYFTTTAESLYRRAHEMDVPVVIHWTGSDILALRTHLEDHPRSLEHAARFTHLATAPWLTDELRDLGVDAACAPFPILKRVRYLAQDPPPLPEQFTVYTYVSDERPDLYGWQLVVRLASEFPEVRFLVARGTEGGLGPVSSNVEFLGWRDSLDDVYAATTVAVRMTTHDGLTGTVQEPLILGRNAIWTHSFPGALMATDYDELREHLARLVARHDAGDLAIHLEGRRHIAERLHPLDLAKDLEARLLTAAGRDVRSRL